LVKLATNINDDASDVQQVSYTLNVPAGSTVVHIVYTGGSLRGLESVHVTSTNSQGSYDATVIVSTGTSSVDVTAATTIPSVGSAEASGRSNTSVSTHIGN
jgi:hypothetical protein